MPSKLRVFVDDLEDRDLRVRQHLAQVEMPRFSLSMATNTDQAAARIAPGGHDAVVLVGHEDDELDDVGPKPLNLERVRPKLEHDLGLGTPDVATPEIAQVANTRA